MTGTYQDNYREALTGCGREIRIADGVVGYIYDLAPDDTIDDAVASFCESYDLNGGDPNVHLSVEVYEAGELVNAAQRDVVIGETSDEGRDPFDRDFSKPYEP